MQMNLKSDMNKLYCCYSVDLKNFLTSNGVRYELCALNPNNNRMFWAYLRCGLLDNLLSEWSNRK